ncbi:MAG: ABC transporter ATP-binding protein/permease [Clostridia bacterium]|nr:ABC transporter ATP-binding protein/permease [Clostridia bacterium]
MLELRSIKKTYLSGENKVSALDGVSVNFRDNEFVAILGPSGSGKTTLLNIIGGLDRYDAGNLVINGRSTKKYSDKDWDGYRNHSVGFVFQSYNLIPHQSVLANVELALTLSGVSKAERRKRAIEVLNKVGLGDQLNKKPNQMSGGQMQRVAIARALVNDPDILLADEPTGALDSKTSVQIMELIREISKDRLVIMVTHNPKLAKEYANRLIRIKDGRIRKDTNPYEIERTEREAVRKPVKKVKGKKTKAPRTSMSFGTALSLSFNNLLTKKGRTLLTSFAGSIGIIGIALILSLSNGMQAYISSIEQGTLSSYPLTIESESMDLSALLGQLSSSDINVAEHELDKIYKKPMLENSVANMTIKTQQNDLGRFKTFLALNEEMYTLCTDIKYGYDVDLQIFKADTSSGVVQVRPSEVLEAVGGSQSDIWTELIGDERLLSTQYDILAGAWPKNHTELVLFVDENNEISDLSFYALGLADTGELEEMINSEEEKKEKTEEEQQAEIQLEGFDYTEFIGLSFKVVPSVSYYYKADGKWVDMRENEAYMKNVVNSGQELKIVGIARPKAGTQSPVSGGMIGYMSGLTESVLELTNNSKIVKDQKAKPTVDVFTGLKFKTDDKNKKTAATAAVSMPDVVFSVKTAGLPEAAPMQTQSDIPTMSEDEIYDFINKNIEDAAEKERLTEFVKLMLKDIRSSSDRKKLMSYLEEMLADTESDPQQVYNYIQLMNKDTKLKLLSIIITAVESGEKVEIPGEEELKKPGSSSGTNNNSSSANNSKPKEEEKEKFSNSTYEENLSVLGVADIAQPSTINIYPIGFEAKERIAEIIEEYNQQQIESGNEAGAIVYTDYVSLVMSSVTQIIDIVTYALVAFVAISLVVSSIMIGIITYISVLERTKEIGILRSIGASKKDISRVFNSETIIVGFVSGVMGILVSLLLLIPINAIINAIANIENLAAMPLYGGIALIVISVVLTVIAGLVPSRVAAKKDPVIALRSE